MKNWETWVGLFLVYLIYIISILGILFVNKLWMRFAYLLTFGLMMDILYKRYYGKKHTTKDRKVNHKRIGGNTNEKENQN